MIDLDVLLYGGALATLVVYGVLPELREYNRQQKIRRRLNAIDSLAPFNTSNRLPPALRGMTLALSDHLSVKELAVFHYRDPPPRIVVHVRLSWWSLLTLGWIHRRTRDRVATVLRRIAPRGILPVIGKITVWYLPRGNGSVVGR
jgi:hypothetical protein